MTILKQSLPTLRVLLFFWAISFPGVIFHISAEGSESLPTKTVALLSDGQSEPLTDLTLRFKKAFQILAQGEVNPVFNEDPAYSAKWQEKRAANALRAALKNPHVDLVFINGPLLAAEAAKMPSSHPKPVVGFFTFDPAFVLQQKTEYNLGEWSNGGIIFFHFLLTASYSFILALPGVLGEEIGWRGFLVPELAKHAEINFTQLVSWMVENASCDG